MRGLFYNQSMDNQNEKQKGEYMKLLWEGDAPYECIRGHVSEDEAARILNAEQSRLGDGGLTVVHKFARWSFPDSFYGSEGYDRVLNTYDAPAKGRFKITQVYRA